MPAANLAKEVVDTIRLETKDKLSKGAVILAPEDKAFNIVPQWSDYDRETPAAILQPATECDAQVFVSSLIKNKIPFKAHGGGHSNFSTIASPGVILDTGLLRKITVDAASQTAIVEAGCTNGEISQALFNDGFATTLGTCDTVGIAGICFGGGVGPAQGLYGMVSDQLVSVRVVTGASGELVTASENENPDLFFALRGAGGFGFGVVTSVSLKVHPIATLGDAEGKVWSIYSRFSDTDIAPVLAKLMELTNDDNERLDNFGMLGCLPPDFKPGVHIFSQWYGDAASRDAMLSKILDVAKPIHQEIKHVPWPKLNEMSAPFNELGGFKTMQGTGVTNIRDATKMFSEFSDLIKTSPESARGVILLEFHPRKAFVAIGEDSTAFPHRKVKLWVNAVTWYTTPDSKETNLKWLKLVRAAVTDPSERPNSYMNFRFGDEPVEHLMTHNTWSDSKKEQRLEKLRAVKSTYDPSEIYGKNVF